MGTWSEPRIGEVFDGEHVELVDGDNFERCHFYGCSFPPRPVRVRLNDCTLMDNQTALLTYIDRMPTNCLIGFSRGRLPRP